MARPWNAGDAQHEAEQSEYEKHVLCVRSSELANMHYKLISD